MFVIWDCECVGIRTTNGTCVVITPCDAEQGPPWAFAIRPGLDGKAWMPLSNDKAEHLIGVVGRLVGDGQRMQTIQRLLGVPS